MRILCSNVSVYLSTNVQYCMKNGLGLQSISGQVLYSRRIKSGRYTDDCLLVGAPSKKTAMGCVFRGWVVEIWVDRRSIVSAMRHFKTFLPLFDFYRTLF
jgi:hypothetical protein